MIAVTSQAAGQIISLLSWVIHTLLLTKVFSVYSSESTTGVWAKIQQGRIGQIPAISLVWPMEICKHVGFWPFHLLNLLSSVQEKALKFWEVCSSLRNKEILFVKTKKLLAVLNLGMIHWPTFCAYFMLGIGEMCIKTGHPRELNKRILKSGWDERGAGWAGKAKGG